MVDRTFTIRPMTRREMDIAIDWAAAEGWNPGLHDAECFYAADPNGFLVGLLDDEPIATLSAVRYGKTFAFLGFYIVKDPYRGRGYGLRMCEAGLARVQGRVMGLDGVVAQQENYKKSGFALAYRNIRFQGAAVEAPADAPDIVPLSNLPFDQVNAYDKPFFPDDRTDFLKCWIRQPESTALGILRDNRLAGYGVLRRCRSGYKIGPLFADDAAGAERLYSALAASAPEGAPVFLDIPEPNAAAVELVKRHGMTSVFETARMYAGGMPDLPLDRLFGVTTFELG